MISYTENYRLNVHNATAITTGSANQWPNTPYIRLWIDVTFWGLEDSYRKTEAYEQMYVARKEKKNYIKDL